MKRYFLFIAVCLFILSCKKDEPLHTSFDLRGCEKNIASDTITAYQKIVGTWEWQGSKLISRLEGGTIIVTPKTYGHVISVVFDSNDSLKYYEDGSLKYKSDFTIIKINGYGLEINSDSPIYGGLDVCDSFLVVINSDRDLADDYYKRVK